MKVRYLSLLSSLQSAVDLKDKTIEMGQGVLDLVTTNAPEALDTVRTAMNNFASNLKMPFTFG